MTKRSLWLGLGLVVLGACLSRVPLPIPLPGEIVIEAQTLPITKTLAWDDADASITGYTVTLDGATIGTPTTKTQAVTFSAVGPHTLTVSATNIWGTSTATTLQVLVQLPTAPANERIQ